MKLGFLILALVATSCATQQPRLDSLGKHSFPVTTRSPAAQRAFDRGLTLSYAFMHYAAEQEFRRAAEADPQCAMAYWGIALVNGPHINFPVVTPERAAVAWDAIGQAQKLAPSATPLEQSLITALSTRYAQPQPADRRPLDTAYAAAMRRLWQQHPENADVGTLFVEAAMDLHPWDLWQDGQPQPWTPEITGALEQILELHPYHPGANHLYIHAIEASPQPEKAVAAADRLRRLVPDASHLVHMPAHIYARVGRWEQAGESNRDARRADDVYRAAYPRPGFYAMYMTHNTHFLAFVYMMQGRHAESIGLARQMIADIPPEFVTEYAGVADGFMIFPSKVLMRFGRWEEILAEPRPPEGLPLALALWHYTRGAAFAGLDRLDEARTEREAFLRAAAAVPADATFGNNSSRDLVAIAARVLDGEIATRQGDFETAIRELREAVRLEDALRYDEPPDWVQPVRHTLGAVLLRAGKAEEAAATYREDLEKFPGNGWALLGLRDALERQGRTDEARQVGAQWKQAWKKADIEPPSTCYCVTDAK